MSFEDPARLKIMPPDRQKSSVEAPRRPVRTVKMLKLAKLVLPFPRIEIS